jgi:hypothetical protein
MPRRMRPRTAVMLGISLRTDWAVASIRYGRVGAVGPRLRDMEGRLVAARKSLMVRSLGLPSVIRTPEREMRDKER